MAIAALVVAIVSALLAAGALLHNIRSFRRSGWDLKVVAWCGRNNDQVHVEITNVGRQACEVSEIRYFISRHESVPAQERVGFSAAIPPVMVFSDHEAVAEPIAPSAKVEVIKDFGITLPAVFSLEVWVWTGGRPYRSERSMHPF
ncbi:MAG TPA: hypothetical protein VMA73_14245 [Streptosporangiaceae bacterium]|jgi:hypothetical protein|nr:hypothetical protein [Streptosporangiaceae bacterium]